MVLEDESCTVSSSLESDIEAGPLHNPGSARWQGKDLLPQGFAVTVSPHRTRFSRAFIRWRELLGWWRGLLTEGLEAEALAGLLARSQRVVAQSQALFFKLTSAADQARTAKTQGAASTADLLSSNLGGDRADSARNVRTANAIHKTLAQAAMDKGLITKVRAEVIVRTLTGLPSDVSVTQRFYMTSTGGLRPPISRRSSKFLRRPLPPSRRALLNQREDNSQIVWQTQDEF